LVSLYHLWRSAFKNKCVVKQTKRCFFVFNFLVSFVFEIMSLTTYNYKEAQKETSKWKIVVIVLMCSENRYHRLKIRLVDIFLSCFIIHHWISLSGSHSYIHIYYEIRQNDRLTWHKTYDLCFKAKIFGVFKTNIFELSNKIFN
jgi:hypothetical protein